MSDASLPQYCHCGVPMRRVFDVPHFTEDRCRFSRNPRTGKDFSDMLGMAYPKDRKERDAVYKMKGIEPVTKSDMPNQWKVAMEYNDHVRTGGNRLTPKKEKELVEKPDLSGVKSVTQQLRESNVSLA